MAIHPLIARPSFGAYFEKLYQYAIVPLHGGATDNARRKRAAVMVAKRETANLAR